MTGLRRRRFAGRTLRIGIAVTILAVAALALISVCGSYVRALWMAATHGPEKTYPMPQRLAAGMRGADDWFVVARIANGTYAIGEPRYGQCNFSYLLVGTRRALLWDSGPGIRNIHEVIAGITSLPVIAMPSHLHFDHIGGLRYFSDIALPDVEGLRARIEAGMLRLRTFEYLGLIEGRPAPRIHVSRWIAPGAGIDLGGRVLRIAASPGHTDTSIVLLDRANDAVFTGDTIYPGEVWAFLPGTDLRALEITLKRLGDQATATTSFFGGHGCVGIDKELVVPRLTRNDVRSLQADTSVARQIRLSVLPPRRFAANSSVSLAAKDAWMLK